MKLGKDVFLALAQVAWADGEMKSGEADALLRAARAAGLAGADLEAVERATKSKDVVKKMPKLSIAPGQAEFAYALACALSASDGEIAESEREAIAALGDKLKIPFDVRARAAAASVAVAKSIEVGASAIEALERELTGSR
jgi:hypothetical protein